MTTRNNKQRFIFAILTVLAWLAFPRLAQAYDIKLCAEVTTSYTDNDYGEDLWTADEGQEAQGMRIRVRRYNSCDFSGASGYMEYVPWTYANVNGCSPEFSTTLVDACYEIALASYGEVPSGSGTNYVYGYDASGVTNWWKITGVDPPNQSGPSWWLFPELDAFRMYLTGAKSLREEQGSLTGATFKVYPVNDPEICCPEKDYGGSYTCAYPNRINVCLNEESGAQNRKFLISHEVGHGILWLEAGSWNNGDCSNHGMTVQKVQACAMMEGWANFTSASVWNLAWDNADGKLRYWGDCEGDRTIDVENAGNAAGCVIKYMENNYSSSTWSGMGTELDWMRAWWDYRTNDLAGQPGSPVTTTTMQAEWVGYLPVNMHAERAYDDYRKGVAAHSGCEQYERAVFMAAAHGADHCDDEGVFVIDWCDDVPGCTDVD
jgi:hypothetical protein